MRLNYISYAQNFISLFAEYRADTGLLTMLSLVKILNTYETFILSDNNK